MKTTRWTPLAVVALAGLVACGGGDQQTQAEGEQAADTAQQAGEAMGTSFYMRPKNESGVSGEARMARRDEAIQVRMTLSGVASGSTYPVHLHKGRCQTGGGVATGLTKISATDTTATSSVTINAGVLFPDSSYFVQAHLPDGTPAACANVPASVLRPAGGN